MPAEAELSELIGEVVGGVVHVENVTPRIGTVKRCMDDRHIGALDGKTHREGGEPELILFGELGAGPEHGGFRVGVESLHEIVAVGCVFIVVSLDDGEIRKGADDVEALLRIGVVADDVAETDIVFDLFLFADGEDSVQGFEVAVDIADDGIFHSSALRIIDRSAVNSPFRSRRDWDGG